MSVRFLLNVQTQESESVILNLIEAEDLSCVLMLLGCCEPRAEIESRGSEELNRQAALGRLNARIET